MSFVNTCRHGRTAVFVACLASLALAPPAHAQQGTAGHAPAQQSEDASTLPAVTVTAQPLSVGERASALPEAYAGGQVSRGSRLGLLGNQDFMETPFSTTAYTEQHIADTQAKDIGSVIGASDTSVYVPITRGIMEGFLIRGFPVDATAEITFNGLASMAPYMRSATEMAERVEVLRGPSAMLKGMAPNGAIGGSINIVPKRAGETPLTRLSATHESDRQFGLHADVGRRFGQGQQFGLRFNGVARDGRTAVDAQEHRMGLGALALDWRGERVRLSTDLYRQRERIDGTDYFGIFSIAPAVTRLPVAFKGSRNLAAPWTFGTNSSTAGMARAEWDINGQTMAYAAYGQRHADYDALIAQNRLLNDAGDLRVGLIRQYRIEKTRSAEAGLQGRVRTGTITHDWALAATAYKVRFGVRNIRGSTDPDFLRRWNLYAPNFGAMPNLDGFSTSNVPYTGKNELRSVGLADRLSFMNDRMQLTLGARWQSIKSKGIYGGAGYDRSALSPSVALLIKPLPALSVYGSYIQGLNQGATAPAVAANAGETLPPYKSKQYELGAKYDHGRFAVTAALFQITQPSAYTDPVTNVFGLHGEQRNRGLELGFFGEAQHGLRLMGGMTWLDARLRRQLNAGHDGKQATGVPRLIARLGLEYDIAAVPGLTLTGLLNHVGKRHATADNRLSLSPYATVDVGARYATRVAGQPLTLRASVKNLTNKAYWGGSWLASGDSGLSGGLGAPRTFMLSASMDF